MSDPSTSSSNPDGFGWAYAPTLLGRIVLGLGWLFGWIAYGLARAQQFDLSEKLADTAIRLRRHNPGAARAIGVKSGYDGRRAGFRGQLIVEGRIADCGPFAGNGFFATYHVAAFNLERALNLIRRFEYDAVPSSLRVDSGKLDHPDSGAEGVLWVKPGRIFWKEPEEPGID